MAKQFSSFEPEHLGFVAAQHVFFVGSAAESGRVNVSPKGTDSLRILGPDRLIWLNLTGSGNETAGHIARINRMTIMWCSFAARPLILRAYGTARMVQPGDADWAGLAGHFPADVGARQVFDMAVGMVMTSCGWGVPFMDHAGERPTIRSWAEAKGAAGLRDYRAEKNAETIDGFPTGVWL